MSSPKVLFLIGQLVRGGAEQQLYNLLAHSHLNAVVVSFSPGGYWANPIRELGYPVIELERRGRMEVRRLWRVSALIREHRPDLIYIFVDGISGLYGRLGVLLARHHRLIIGQRSHPIYFPRWYRTLLPGMNKAVKAVICNSYSARDYLVGHRLAPTAKTLVIPNGIDARRFGQPSQTWPWPEAWHGKQIIGTVTHLTPAKSPETFVRLAACGRKRHPDLRFALIGGGPLREEIEALVKSQGVNDILWLAGERQDVPDLLATMDIFVLASRTEGMPNAVMEAMAAGLPCVVTDVGDCAQVVSHQETGIVVPPDDLNLMTDAVVQLANDESRRQSMGVRGQKRIENEFDVRVMASRYEDVFARLARVDS